MFHSILNDGYFKALASDILVYGQHTIMGKMKGLRAQVRQEMHLKGIYAEWTRVRQLGW